MTITQEQIDARKNEVNQIFRANLGTIIDGKWQFYSGVCKQVDASTEQYPLIAEVKVDSVIPEDTWDVNVALGSGGDDEVLEWLESIGVLDGTVEVRINDTEVNDGL